MREMRSPFFRSNRGSVTIEFSIIFVTFILTLLFCSEIGRLLYISASLDLAVSEAAKSAKNKEKSDNISYQTLFRQKFMDQQGVLGTFITGNNTVTAHVKFSNTVSDIINNNMSTTYSNAVLAHYTVNYTYQPVFFPIPSVWANTLLTREVIFVQES
jgi:tight adherence protein E